MLCLNLQFISLVLCAAKFTPFFDAAFLMQQLLYSRAGDFFDAATSV
jgi:hypothetical protein